MFLTNKKTSPACADAVMQRTHVTQPYRCSKHAADLEHHVSTGSTVEVSQRSSQTPLVLGNVMFLQQRVDVAIVPGVANVVVD